MSKPSASEEPTLAPAVVPVSEQATLAPEASPMSAPATAFVPGYELLSELGRGGMGVVYKARQTKLNRVVALKMILAGSHAGTADVARFQTEAEAIARLQHPNIVQVYEVGEHEGKPYFSLEFCGGGSLEKKLNATPLPPREAAALVETLARAMQAAHEQHVIHRDLKPANVLLADDGTLKITDFGLAKKLDEAGQTQSGAIMGTPSYMAPEQAGGKSGEIGPLADVYALGAILYECLTGEPPFRGATPVDTILLVIDKEPIPPSKLQPWLPRDLETICLKCLEKEAARRYASAKAMADDLRRWLVDEPIAARPAGHLERGWRWCKRNSIVAGLSAALMFLVVGALVAIPWLTRQRNDPLSAPPVKSVYGLTATMSVREIHNKLQGLSSAQLLKLFQQLPVEMQKFQPVTKGDVNNDIVAQGPVEAAETSDIVFSLTDRQKAIVVPLRVQWLVGDGAVVKPGDKLVVLDDSALQVQLKGQLGAVEQAKAKLVKSGKDKDATRQFHDSTIKLARLSVEEAESALKKYTEKDADKKRMLERAVEQAQEKAKLAELQGGKENGQVEAVCEQSKHALDQEQITVQDLQAVIARCIVTAPREGQVVYYVPEQQFGPAGPESVVALGELVRPGQKLMLVYGREWFRVKVNVGESKIAQVRPDQQATIQVDAIPLREYAGKVHEVAELAVKSNFNSPDIKFYPVTVALTEKTPFLRPGMNASVTILGGCRKDVLRLPIGSFFTPFGIQSPLCYVKTANRIEERRVVLGFGGNLFVEVVDGVREGELVMQLDVFSLDLAESISRWLNGLPQSENRKASRGPAVGQ